MPRHANGTPASCDRSVLAVTLGTVCATLAVASAAMLAPGPAQALPSYARQTGQPCATCHTAFPELTPYGRRFKLLGYTAGGTRCRQEVRAAGDAGGSLKDEAALRSYLDGPGAATIAATGGGSGGFDPHNIPAVSFMVIPSFTHTAKDQTADQLAGLVPGVGSNDNWQLQTASVFYGGQIYCDLGAFVQGTHDANSTYATLFLDNTDFRYARTARVLEQDIIFGATVHNNPTVQDVWNSTPAWGFPQQTSGIAPSPGAGPMLENGVFGGRVIGYGAYVFINDMLYGEFTAYKAMNSQTLASLGQDPFDGSDRISGMAPYWRLALEKNWGEHSLMLGTFGMLADTFPGNDRSAGTDRFLDVGIDGQYQYLGDVHGLSARFSYIMERQNRDASVLLGAAANIKDTLNSFKASATYHYEVPPLTGSKFAVTGGYFNLRGSNDALLYTANDTASPNSAGWIGEIAWLPFSRGNIAAWPWYNMRIGVQYTAYTKFDGSSSNTDGNGRKASDNNTLYTYFWTAF